MLLVGHFCDVQGQEVEARDLDLMDKVASLVEQKARVLAELKDMNNEAQQRRLAKGDDASMDIPFQRAYAHKVLEVCCVRRVTGLWHVQSHSLQVGYMLLACAA
jgi:hypothetical protein